MDRGGGLVVGFAINAAGNIRAASIPHHAAH
jgi:hypothetical protein